MHKEYKKFVQMNAMLLVMLTFDPMTTKWVWQVVKL
jgi:hypothetical protein